MKKRITLILLTAFALCSCLDRHASSENSIEISKKSAVQELQLVLTQMLVWDYLLFEDGEYKMKEMTKNELDAAWFDERAYKDAKSLINSHNKTLKKMLSKLEETIGTKDYILHDAAYQKEYVNMYNDSGNGVWQNIEINTYDTNPKQCKYEVAEGVTLQQILYYDRDLLSDKNAVNDCLHVLAVQFLEETHVYCTFIPGFFYVALPGSSEEIKITYMTSYPSGGLCMW